MTRAQADALEGLWPRYGLDVEAPLDLETVFGRSSENVLEIGFGMGDSLLSQAAAQTEHNFLGVEVHEAGIGRVLSEISRLGISNIRVIRGDAAEMLERCFRDQALDAVLLFFPDPWPKKRHNKRRLVQPEFVSLVCAKLKLGGRFELATDWQDYAEHMLTVLEAEGRLENLAPGGGFSKRPPQRPVTKFERRGERLGHRIFDLRFVRREILR